MIEIELVGIGGQGSVVASKLLADAAVKAGYVSQAFAAYGAQRRGGEVESYIRLAHDKIFSHSKIYGADFTVFMGEELVDITQKRGKLKKGATILINSSKQPGDFPSLSDFKVITIDAKRIAIEKRLTLPSGIPIINTTVLGALWGLLPAVTLDQLIDALKEGKIPGIDRNIEAAREAYELVQGVSKEPGEDKGERTEGLEPVVFDLLPEYRPKLSPCQTACPAGERIELTAHYIQYGMYEDALETIKEENPFPGICGRVCFHPCETDCNRVRFDEGVATNALERAAFDYADSSKVKKPGKSKSTGKKVAIIGSGPSGMTAAYYLALLGHAITVFEGQSVAGGVPRFGIPEYHLPRGVVDREVSEITDLGVDIKLNSKVGEGIDFNKLVHDYDACLVATGAHRSTKLGIPGEDSGNVYSGLDFLRRVALGEKVSVGKRVVVIGGGNVAMDVARTAKRLGATEIHTVCLENRDEMPAYSWETEAAEAEGVKVQTAWGPSRILADHGKVSGVELKKCTAVFDSSGKFSPCYDDGDTLKIDCDTVITAVGEKVDLPFLDGAVKMAGPVIEADELGKTSVDGLYASGDATSLSRSVVEAIASGKRAAMGIDLFLTGADKKATDAFRMGGNGPVVMKRYLARDDTVENNQVVAYEDLNVAHFEEAPRMIAAELPAKQRVSDFSETSPGLTRESAAIEAERCFHCGACIRCEICYISCPDIAVSLDENGPSFDRNKEMCKSCGICVYECPSNAISWEGVA